MAKTNIQFQNKNNNSTFQIEEGTIAEKTSYVENLNRLIAHINHVAVYPSMGSFVEGVKQLDAMMEAYKDKRFEDDFKEMQIIINNKLKSYSDEDKYTWMEENSSEVARLLFKILMKLMARSGLSPTGRIASIDANI